MPTVSTSAVTTVMTATSGRKLDGSVMMRLTTNQAATPPANIRKPERISSSYLERARGLAEIAAGRGQSLAQLALSWVLRDARVTSALIGASSVAQLENNVAALEAPPLTADELAAIEPLAVHGTV